jgi:SAM-dependent methyltransferase
LEKQRRDPRRSRVTSGTVDPVLRCPDCRGSLRRADGALECSECSARYDGAGDIAVLLPTGWQTEHKSQQAEFFDAADPEWELHRPHGAPALYRWLLDRKFAKSVAALDTGRFRTALTVCGGSGMDAEYLAGRGLAVTCSDLSPAAAQRARERGRRAGIEIGGVVADVEHLPFADDSFDLVYVHDGLHHLEDPLAGLREMARVARLAISVNEPARSPVTRLAIGVGFASHHEEAGNFIARVDPRQVVDELEGLGFRVVHSQRYGMYYRHEPDPIFDRLSRPPLLPIAKTAVRAFDHLAGRLGNKSTVQAVRVTSDESSDSNLSAKR